MTATLYRSDPYLREAPPMGSGRMRLIRIGAGEAQVDLQPCGGTHVRSTAEIGPLRLGKIEKKGKQNRRVTLHLADLDLSASI